ncbi:MAG: NAD(P)/FAD-dependent oxidoreductase [Phycisphaeraceae bacterium]
MAEVDPTWPRVFIVGGGFAGLSCARKLADAPARVTLVDRRNHHLFQPLLYQVATAALSPADIAMPIRQTLRKQANARVVLAGITGVDPDRKRLLFEGGAVEYDYLVLACGATHSYFGHDEWEKVAPGLKTLSDATEIRNRILLAFESAEYEADLERQRAHLTFAIVGGGPTGVELAGAIEEIAAKTLPQDFRHIDTTTTRVILLEGADRLLPPFPPDLSAQTKHDLEALGVEVHLNSMVTNVTSDGVQVGETFIPARTVLWAAGVKASPVGESLGVPRDRAGRVEVNPDLTVPGHPELFVVGDMAAVTSPDTGEAVPGVAPAAMQMGRYVGEIIRSELRGKTTPAQRKPFVYVDKGSLATIGRSRAVARLGRFHFKGFIAWILWALVHITFLLGFRNRIRVLGGWLWNWLLFVRDARLIVGEPRLDISKPRPGEVILAKEGEGEAATKDADKPSKE